jgi:hypothetical protein
MGPLAYDPYWDDQRVVDIPAPVYAPQPDPEDERRYLEQCAEDLKRDLEQIKERLSKLAEAKKPKKE